MTPSSAKALAAAAFASKPAAPEDEISKLLDRQTLARSEGAVAYRSEEVRLSGNNTLRLNVATPLRGLPGAEQAYEVSVIRKWPGAVSFETERFGVDVSPHAGLGVTSFGGLAEAGATVQLSQKMDKAAVDRLQALGVRDGAAFGDQGRWYLFAAASGRAVGLNMLRNEGGWDRAGWTTDPTSTLIGDAQVGVGWRKGPLQTSLGFVHREVKGQHMIFGQETKDDSLVAFSLSVKPKR